MFFYNIFFYPVLAKKSFLSLEEQKLLRQSLRNLAINAYWRQENNLPLNRWSEKNRDCAGFVRYLLWEAYQNHDELWHEREGSPFTQNLPVLKTEMPLIKPFPYLRAKDLIKNNTRYLGKEIPSLHLRTGDLFYFRQKDGTDHLMLVLEDEKEGILLIYHTGKPKDQIRLIKLKDLYAHETRWHPHNSNKYFLGVYRFYFFQ